MIKFIKDFFANLFKVPTYRVKCTLDNGTTGIYKIQAQIPWDCGQFEALEYMAKEVEIHTALTVRRIKVLDVS